MLDLVKMHLASDELKHFNLIENKLLAGEDLRAIEIFDALKLSKRIQANFEASIAYIVYRKRQWGKSIIYARNAINSFQHEDNLLLKHDYKVLSNCYKLLDSALMHEAYDNEQQWTKIQTLIEPIEKLIQRGDLPLAQKNITVILSGFKATETLLRARCFSRIATMFGYWGYRLDAIHYLENAIHNFKLEMRNADKLLKGSDRDFEDLAHCKEKLKEHYSFIKRVEGTEPAARNETFLGRFFNWVKRPKSCNEQKTEMTRLLLK